MLRFIMFLSWILFSVIILTHNLIERWRHYFWFRKTPARPWNPFTTAVLENDVAAVRTSLENGLDPNARLPDTPEMDLTEGGRKEAPVELRVHAPTALMVAASRGYTELTQVLLDFGADVNLATGTRTALHYAADGGHRETVVLLLGRSGKANIRGTHFESALISAASGGQETVVALLLEHGADVNRKAGDGETPLMSAADGNHPEVVRALIAAGADIDARDDEGRTALWWAKRPEARAVLQEAGAKK